MADNRLFLRSIDDYLGNGEFRFFSRGFQRARYDVRDIIVNADPESGVRAKVDVAYPADWSTKDGVDQRPHLSTVDALVLGVQLAELHLAHESGLSGPERARARLRKAVLRAGGAPQEELAGIPLSARLVKSQNVLDTPSRVMSVYDCAVGSLRVRCEIEHPIGTRVATEAEYGGLDDVLGPAARRYYGDGFKARRHHIQDVHVDLEALTAQADVHFTPEADPAAQGVDGELQPAVTFVDAFVVNLQLAQILMYELDSLSRGDSNTLWMMQTFLQAPASPPPLPDRADQALSAEAALKDKRLLSLRGGTWRSVDIEASLAGIGLRCSFAHELPAPAAVTGA